MIYDGKGYQGLAVRRRTSEAVAVLAYCRYRIHGALLLRVASIAHLRYARARLHSRVRYVVRYYLSNCNYNLELLGILQGCFFTVLLSIQVQYKTPIII